MRISLTQNDHISETVQNFEKLKEKNKMQLFFDFGSRYRVIQETMFYDFALTDLKKHLIGITQ